jgi:hypothetical protein
VEVSKKYDVYGSERDSCICLAVARFDVTTHLQLRSAHLSVYHMVRRLTWDKSVRSSFVSTEHRVFIQKEVHCPFDVFVPGLFCISAGPTGPQCSLEGDATRILAHE